MDKLIKSVTIALLIAASSANAQEKPHNVEKPQQFPINVSGPSSLDGSSIPTGGMDTGAGSGGGQGAGGGIPTIDIARVIKEVLANMLLGSVLDPSTLLGKAYGILDTQMQKLDINQQELEQLSNIYETIGQAVTASSDIISGQTNSEQLAAQLAQNSDAQEQAIKAAMVQAKSLGIDPSSINAMRELNNQSIRNYMFSQTIKKVKELSGQPMTYVQRMALKNILDQLSSEMLGQATLNALIAASIKSIQALDENEDAKKGQQIIAASAYMGAKIDTSLDPEDQAPPSQRPNRNFDFKGSQHIFLRDYQAAVKNLKSSSPDAGNQVDPNTGQQQPMGANAGQNQTAAFNNIIDKPGTKDMAQGVITVNGRSYNFNSGGSGRGYLPAGEYTISNLQYTSQAGMVSGRGTSQQFGYKAFISDKYDSRVGGTRELLRIHPDEGSNGTMGCIGILGDPATQRQFYSDLQSELQRNGGSFTLNVG